MPRDAIVHSLTETCSANVGPIPKDSSRPLFRRLRKPVPDELGVRSHGN